MADTESPGQRIDKWLWFARVAKTRTLAASLVVGGKVRLNRVKTDKPSHLVKAGDVITVMTGPRVRVLRVVDCGERRGPAAEARGLFEELTPVQVHPKPTGGSAETGTVAADAASGGPNGGTAHSGGRPNKRERRQIARLKGKTP